jgi:high-affinity K+ transport system ATPase subunit B
MCIFVLYSIAMKAIDVKPLDGNKIKVVFNDGVSGVIDLNDLIGKGIFQQLKDEVLFRKVYIDGSAIAWSPELEIDADNIYAEILNSEPEKLLHTPSYNAAD